MIFRYICTITVALYIDTVPNRNSPPAILLHEGWREGGKVKKRTLANLSKWPQEKIESLRRLLKNEPLVRREEAFDVERSLPVHSFPTLVISGAPLLLAIIVQSSSGWLAFVSIFNAAAACGDLFGAGVVLAQIPATAKVRNQGWITYWKKGDLPVRTLG